MMHGPLKSEDDRDDPSRAEKALMVVSVALTLFLFLYAAYQGYTAPSGPQVSVEVAGTEIRADDVHVHVVLHNNGPAGFRAVTVEVTCDTPAPQATLDNIPADASRRATIVCPPGTTAPEAGIVALVPT